MEWSYTVDRLLIEPVSQEMAFVYHYKDYYLKIQLLYHYCYK